MIIELNRETIENILREHVDGHTKPHNLFATSGVGEWKLETLSKNKAVMRYVFEDEEGDAADEIKRSGTVSESEHITASTAEPTDTTNADVPVTPTKKEIEEESLENIPDAEYYDPMGGGPT